MNSNLQKLRTWLSEQYGSLGLSLSETNDGVAECRMISLDESRSELFDRQIGAWIRFSHLTSTESARDVITQDVRWALDAISSLEVRSGLNQDRVDLSGAWQVHVVWLVPASCKSIWEQSIRGLRSRSAHPEEVGLDLIDIGNGTIEEALKSEGVPALLLKSRSILSMKQSEMPLWVSPDTAFEKELRSSPKTIHNSEHRKFFESFLDSTLSQNTAVKSADTLQKFSCGKLIIKNFRNIVDADLALDGESGVTVIHGANGSGKSSLFEAISLAMIGSSDRLVGVLEDGDLTSKIKAGYVANILTRFGSRSDEKLVLTNDGIDVVPEIASDKNIAKERLRDARGTVLAQESARRFVEMSANEAAAYVLGDYSPLARRIQNDVDNGLQKAKAEWQGWLRSLNLNAAITKRETILQRIVQGALVHYFPSDSLMVFTWLQAMAKKFPEVSSDVSRVRSAWNDLDSQDGRELIADQISKAIEKSQNPEAILLAWILRRIETLNDIGVLVSKCDVILDPIRSDWSRIKEELNTWNEWLRKSASNQINPVIDSKSEDDRALREKSFRERLAELAPKGQLLKSRKDHLDSLISTLLPKWKEVNPHSCPTCDAQHGDGIDVVVMRVAKEIDEIYATVRADYASIQAELKGLQVEASATGECPLSKERIIKLSALLRFEPSGPSSLEAALSIDPGALLSIVAEIERVLVKQSVSAPLAGEVAASLASDMIKFVVERDIEGTLMRELPAAWDTIKKAIDSIALRVISEHLPNTIGSLWTELSLALAPARWNQSSRPRMSIDSSRGSERLSIVVTNSTMDIPARHILNQAEQHVLGLAWFFTSYLSHGRFRASALVLDDPAHEMDQVTYRKFVRFIQAFIRMHKSLSHHIKVVAFLHQEERALDLARAATIDGALTILEWSREIHSRGPDATVKQLRLRNPSQQAPLPAGLQKAPEHSV